MIAQDTLEVGMPWVLLGMYVLSILALVQVPSGGGTLGLLNPRLLRLVVLGLAMPAVLVWSLLRSALDGSGSAQLCLAVFGLLGVAVVRQRLYRWWLVPTAPVLLLTMILFVGRLHPAALAPVLWFTPLVLPGLIVGAVPRAFVHHGKVVWAMVATSVAVHWMMFGDEYRTVLGWLGVNGYDLFRAGMSLVLGGLTTTLLLVMQHPFAKLFGRRYSWLDIVRGRELDDQLAKGELKITRRAETLWELFVGLFQEDQEGA